MMRKSEGKPAAENQPTPAQPGAAQPPNTAGAGQKPGATPRNLISSSKEDFLLVNVCKGATKAQLIQAIDEALEASDVPFFKEKKQSPQGGGMAPATAQAQSQQTDAVDALLMLVRQEGW